MKPIIFETAFQTYTAIDILGEGGAGMVYKATDDNSNNYAIKSLKKASTEKRKRFQNELSFGFKNRHKNIITISDYGLSKDEPFYVMPLFDQSLKSLMTTKIDPDKVLIYFAQILDGVEAAHLKGVIHRDLKPENVLFDKKNDNLMIADFGIAHFTEEEMKTLVETKPDTRLANFIYAAPEQKYSGGVVTKQADIYALGLMLNEMFTGQVPHGTNYTTIGSQYPLYTYLDDLVSSMIRQDASQRPDSIEEIKKELIGRRKDFIHLQELSKLTGTVIKITEIDDPLVNDPPKLIDFDWDDGWLTLKLNRVVTRKWVKVFNSITGVQFFWGQGPSTLQFDGDTTIIRARESVIQQSIDFFKEWLIAANHDYVQFLKKEKEQEEERLKNELQEKIDKETRKREAVKNIKI